MMTSHFHDITVSDISAGTVGVFPITPLPGDSGSSIVVVHPIYPLPGDSSSSIVVVHPIYPLPGDTGSSIVVILPGDTCSAIMVAHPSQPYDETGVSSSTQISDLLTSMSTEVTMFSDMDPVFDAVGIQNNMDTLLLI